MWSDVAAATNWYTVNHVMPRGNPDKWWTRGGVEGYLEATAQLRPKKSQTNWPLLLVAELWLVMSVRVPWVRIVLANRTPL